MVRTAAFVAAVLPLAAAYPWAMEASRGMQARQSSYAERADDTVDEGVIPPVRDPVFLSGRSNSGILSPNPPFNADEQYVDVSPGSGNEWMAPTASQIRGPCPGLNAAANHGFLDRSGVTTILNTVEGLGAAFNMNSDLSLTLAVIAVALSGDIITQTWSIGGEYTPPLGGLGGLLGGKPKGIIGTHNEYEGDCSIVRGDAYLHGGDQVFEMRSWRRLYPLADSEGGLTLDKVARHNDYTHGWSILNNPYYFAGPFSCPVTIAAHNFVVTLMSNHSAEHPGGYLDGETLKSFFGVTGEPGNFVHNVGSERIPDRWYKRAGGVHAYNLASTVLDGLTGNAMYPGILSIGGNTGTVDSFTGLDLGDVTGGLYNLGNLAEGNNAACFLLQVSQAGLSDSADGLLSVVGDVLAFVTKQLGPLGEQLSCPELASYDNELFKPYPGASQRYD